MLHDLQLRNFRCFESIAVEFESGFNFIIGANGVGKTSLLEAACILLRLQSQRAPHLTPAVRMGQRSFVLSGHADAHLLQFYYSTFRRKVAFDGVEQRDPAEYLRLGKVVSFANHDLELVRGPAEARRRYLDFIGAQVEARYRPALRAYERALRSRNALLKSAAPRPRELSLGDWPPARRPASARSATGRKRSSWSISRAARKTSPPTSNAAGRMTSACA